MTDKAPRGVIDPTDLKKPRGKAKTGAPIDVLDHEIAQVYEQARELQALKVREAYEVELVNTLQPVLENHYATAIVAQPHPDEETTSRYVGLFKKFAKACLDIGATPLPVRPVFVAAYVHEHADEARDIAEAIRLAHLAQGFADPTQAELVQAVLASAQPPKLNGKSRDGVAA